MFQARMFDFQSSRKLDWKTVGMDSVAIAVVNWAFVLYLVPEAVSKI